MEWRDVEVSFARPARPPGSARRSAPGSSAVLFGEFGCGNLGNEASLDAVLAWFARRPEVTIGSITREPEAVTAEHHIDSVSMFADRSRYAWLPGRLRKIAHKLSDPWWLRSVVEPGQVLVIPGTGVLEQQMSGPPWGLPLALYGLAVATRSRGAELAVVGIGASHDTRRSARWLTRGILARASFVSVRDEYSKAALRSMGVDTAGVRVFPDVAFTLPDVERLDAYVAGPGSRPLRVGLGVISYHDQDSPDHGAALAARYEEQLTGFCRWLVEQGHAVSLLVGDSSDVALAGRVADLVSVGYPDATVETRGYPTWESLLRSVEQLDVVVGSRYHNLIFGLAAGKPVLSLGYADKCERLLAAAGLEAYALRLETATADDLVAVFTRLVEALPEATDRARRYTRAAVRASHEHRDAFLDEFFGAGLDEGARS